MKAFYTRTRFLISTLIIFLLCNCKDEVVKTRTYHMQVPMYLTISKLRAVSVAVQEPRELAAPGKIYIYGDYLFISEVNKGVHIVDNRNPSAPVFLNFINIPGNADMAVNDNILYADSYVDLLAFDVSDPRHIKPVKRVEDVFEKSYLDKAKGLIVAYKDTVITETIKQSTSNRHHDTYFASALSSYKQSYGTGGSTARFTLMSDHLYTVDDSRLKLFAVSEPRNPKYLSTINLGWGIETIFPYESKLFIGSNSGMHIYDASTPSAPVRLSTYQHIVSCDPVVVEGKYAYVTLRSGTNCQRGQNVLDVLNIEDPKKPIRISSFPMKNPHGLTISNSNLFICEGDFGLKAFNGANPLNIGQSQLSYITNVKATDVIAGPKSLIVTGSQGIYQYEYSNPTALRLLSHTRLTSNPQ